LRRREHRSFNALTKDGFAERLPQILASDTNLGCRHLIESQPELVHVHESTNSRFITDLDALQDVEELAQRTGWWLELPGSKVIA
jgi:hypothetical protein